MGKQWICWLILGLFLFVSTPLFATHIVGGEFELKHLKNQDYKLSLILYNDDVNGNPDAIDGFANVHIWSKRDNRFVRTVYLPFIKRSPVNYTNPACFIPQLKTSKVVYESEVTLNPSMFSDPEGYYVTYERCCRNNVINNIENPQSTGQTFYLEFPPVVKGGEPFINSSPILFPPLSDFARLGYPFHFDFRGTDPDGDSLVYSLVNPLAGFSSPDFAIPRSAMPAPYPEVRWASGYSTTKMVPGDPALNINKDGFLMVKPRQEGLYVFSVKAEEYRDGVKIGEVRRDFQMLVYNYGGEDFPPVLEAQKGNGQIFRDFISITEADFAESSSNRCVSLKVTDADIKQEDGYLENLRFQIVPQNFRDASVIELSVKQGTVSRDKPELFLEVCLPDCPPVFDQPYKFNIVAFDDACSVPLTDTLRVEVLLTPPANEPAYIMHVPDNTPTRKGSHKQPAVQEGSAYDFEIEGFDADGDELMFNWTAQGFDAQEWGFTISPMDVPLGTDGRSRMKYRVHWDATCSSQRDFGKKDKFTFLFSLDDRASCDQHKEATYQMDFSVIMPGNVAPEVLTSLNNYNLVQPQEVITREVPFEKEVIFTVRAEDKQQDQLRLRAVGKDFNLQDWGMNFEPASGVGTVTSDFRWLPTCNQVFPDKKNEFTVYFISEDAAQCKNSLSDTITVQLNVLFPENNAPELSAQGSTDGGDDNIFEIEAGESISVLLRGIDANKLDNLQLILQGIEADSESFSYSWQDASGTGGEVSSLLTFTAACEMLKGAPEALVTFNFNVSDDPCYDKQADTVAVKVLVKDKPQDFDRVRYINAFTPNGDRCNAFFEIKNLPEDACNNSFENIQIYNRWGKLLFESRDRNFKWDGEGQPAGTYYYLLKYTNMTYRSPLSIILGDRANDGNCNQ